MTQRIRVFSIAMAIACSTSGRAHAQYGYQYPPGYGGYGWGGWGSTPGGSLARGLGAYNMGRGTANVDNAVAGSINSATVQNWNNYLYRSTKGAASRYDAHLRYEMAKTSKDRAQVEDRIRNHPEPDDILDGDALNALLDALLSPEAADRSIREIKAPLKHDLIPEIPFEFASEGMTICLDRMTMDEQWPLALRVEGFRPEREAVRKAVAVALDEDKKGDLEPATIEAVRAAVDRLQAKFRREVPPTAPDYYPARDVVKAMAGIAKMLYSPEVDKILAELEDYQGTTLGDLLGFMQSFNLRFAPANSFRQKQLYRKLYPMLADAANGPSGGVASVATGAVNAAEKAGTAVEKAAGDAVDGLKSAATDLFKGMK